MQRAELVATWCNSLIFIYLSPIFSFYVVKIQRKLRTIIRINIRERKKFKEIYYKLQHIVKSA